MSFSVFLSQLRFQILFFSSLIFGILILLSPFFSPLNISLQNTYIKLKAIYSTAKVSDNILVVELDEKSIKDIGTYPFERKHYITLLENLRKFDVPVVGYDFLFLDPSPVAQNDGDFINAIEQKSDTVFGMGMDTSGSLFFPFSWLKKEVNSGYLAPQIDPSSRIVYAFSPQIQDENHFAIQLYKTFYKNFLKEDLGTGKYVGQQFRFDNDSYIPLSRKKEQNVLIHYSPESKFQKISFSDLLDSQNMEKLNSIYNFQEKIILIGPAAEGLKDEFFTPLGKMYGVYVHANILNTLLTKQFNVYFDKIIEYIVLYCIILLTIFVNLVYRSQKLLFGNILIIIIFWGIFPFSIVLFTPLILNFPTQIVVSFLFTLIITNFLKYILEETQKTKLNQALSDYVGSEVAQEVTQESGNINLNGEKKSLVCFFSDIEGFTSFSERISPEELVKFLREYLSLMTEAIMEKKGYVNKYEGDAIMALWGVFSERNEDDFIQVCHAALLQQKICYKLSQSWEKTLAAKLHIRIGIHAGNAIVGNIGAIGKKIEFTALGDTINITSRLEGVNKFYGTYICVSDEIYEKTKEVFEYRYIDTIRLKGKAEALKIYELLDTDDISHEKEKSLEKYSKAQELYLSRRFDEALQIFQELAQLGDGPSKTFAERCLFLSVTPPPLEWDGVWIMTEK